MSDSHKKCGLENALLGDGVIHLDFSFEDLPEELKRIAKKIEIDPKKTYKDIRRWDPSIRHDEGACRFAVDEGVESKLACDVDALDVLDE